MAEQPLKVPLTDANLAAWYEGMNPPNRRGLTLAQRISDLERENAALRQLLAEAQRRYVYRGRIDDPEPCLWDRISMQLQELGRDE